MVNIRRALIALVLCACGGGPPEYPRNEEACDQACAYLAFLGCPEGYAISCVYTCKLSEQSSYMRPLADCVLHEKNLAECWVRCNSLR